jgi:pilus assembly protein CpaB
MGKRFVAVLIFAFIMATAASMSLYRLTSNRSQLAAAPLTTKVVLASRDLELGSVIREGDLMLTDWLGEVPSGAAARTRDLVGRGVISKIYAKEAILESRLAIKGAGGGFSAMIPPGMRAVAVPVNEVVDVAGFVLPGMRVDVLSSGTPPGAQWTVTRTILQNIEVLSAGHNIEHDMQGKAATVQVVNVLVTPEQAEQISLASHQTTIQLVLRNPMDRDVAKTPGAVLPQLFGLGKPKAVEAVAPPVRRKHRPQPSAKRVESDAAPPPPPATKEKWVVMEIISGNKKDEHRFGPGEVK